MADTSRFQDGGILIEVPTLPASGVVVGQLVTLATDGALYRWDGSNWVAITTGGSGASRSLNTQTADSAALNAGTGAGVQNFNNIYTVPASTLAEGDTLDILISGSVTQAAGFNFVVGLNIQGVIRGAVTYGALGASTQWQVQARMTVGATNAARISMLGVVGGGSATAVTEVFYDDQGYTVGSAGAIQAYVTMSGGNAGNIAIQRFRTVSVLKAA